MNETAHLGADIIHVAYHTHTLSCILRQFYVERNVESIAPKESDQYHIIIIIIQLFTYAQT
jgi:hypothetical protein